MTSPGPRAGTGHVHAPADGLAAAEHIRLERQPGLVTVYTASAPGVHLLLVEQDAVVIHIMLVSEAGVARDVELLAGAVRRGAGVDRGATAWLVVPMVLVAQARDAMLAAALPPRAGGYERGPGGEMILRWW